jgi:hypothetical protein
MLELAYTLPVFVLMNSRHRRHGQLAADVYTTETVIWGKYCLIFSLMAATNLFDVRLVISLSTIS